MGTQTLTVLPFGQMQEYVGIMNSSIRHFQDLDTSRPTTSTYIPDLTGQVILQDRFAAAHGGFADVYIGNMLREAEGTVKVWLHKFSHFQVEINRVHHR